MAYQPGAAELLKTVKKYSGLPSEDFRRFRREIEAVEPRIT
jgi:hypothetical protein